MGANTLERELKRGSAEVLILALLEERQRHGYEIGQLIASRSDGAINFHITSLYPRSTGSRTAGLIEGRWSSAPASAAAAITAQRACCWYLRQPAWRRLENFVALNRIAKIQVRIDRWKIHPRHSCRARTTACWRNWCSTRRRLCRREGRGMDAREADVRAGRTDSRVGRGSGAVSPAAETRAGDRASGDDRPPLPAILQDTGYAWRLLRRQPAYAAVLVVTIAPGISATTVLGSVAYSVLLKPLPWADAPRLVQLHENRQGSTRRFRPTMHQRRLHRAAAIAADARRARRLDYTGAEPLGGARTDPRRPDHAEPVADAAGIARDRPWLAPGTSFQDASRSCCCRTGYRRQRFGGRGDIVGQTLRLDGTTYTIVGVMPASFAFPDRETRAWMPFHVPPVKQPGQQGLLDPDVPGPRTAARRCHTGTGGRGRHGARTRRA